jgi:putative pyruvate formate lyase activating enzyme
MNCNLCPRRCDVDRSQRRGVCGMGENPVVARIAPHYDEEPCISGARGSGAVFFSGCSLRCAFCQNSEISCGGFGREIDVPALRRAIDRLVEAGCHNINLVNPTHFTPAILSALKAPLTVPVVWNSSGYELPETLKALEGRVTVFLPDLKYVDPALSARYSGAPDYFERASKALLEMYRQVSAPKLNEDGLIVSGLIVRHLILPGCAEDSMRVLDWIAANLPGAWVSLMAQYTPAGRAHEYPEIDRRLKMREYERVVNHLIQLGLDEGYVQELSSADERYVPAFDLTGV